MAKKLILCICGAGINTSMAAKDFISEELRKRKIKDVDIKHTTVSDLKKYMGTPGMAGVFMTRADGIDLGCPQFQGLVFLIGKKSDKIALVDKILEAVYS